MRAERCAPLCASLRFGRVAATGIAVRGSSSSTLHSSSSSQNDTEEKLPVTQTAPFCPATPLIGMEMGSNRSQFIDGRPTTSTDAASAAAGQMTTTAPAAIATAAAATPPPLLSFLHRRQTCDWDCGVACVYSLLVHLGAPTLLYAHVLSDVAACEQRVWTIDLAFLLHAYGVRGLRMCSALIGVDPAHARMTFYDHFDRDTLRVQRTFEEAARVGIDVQQRRLSTAELSDLLLSGHVLLLLVDHRFLHCSSCCSTVERAQRRAAPEFSGHFILAVSLDPTTGTVRFLDPDGRHTLCSAPLAELDEARRSDGTDEDVVIVRLGDNKGRVPKLVHRAAVGLDEADKAGTGAASASAAAASSAAATVATAAPSGKVVRSAPGSSSASMLMQQPPVRRSARLAAASSAAAASATCASMAPPPVAAVAAASASGASAATSSSAPAAATATAADIVFLPHGSKLPGLSSTELALLRAKQRRIRSTRAAVERTLPGGKTAAAAAALRNALASCVVFAQEEAGSGVCVHPAGWILTCAHCVGESADEWWSNRLKWLLTTGGVAVRARCHVWDPKRDLALLRVVAVELGPEGASASASPFPFVTLSSSAPALGAHLLCIGQPGPEDLETASATPVASGYDLVHVSTGVWRGLVPGADPHDCADIGSGRHDCWTYWGHSGAPLLRSEDGTLVGLHSSWDDQTAMRHGVPLEPLRAFFQAHLPPLPAAASAASAAVSASSASASSSAAAAAVAGTQLS